ncbi:class I SAM-dependent methyltransferase [uncultured Thomasclavelia sp.]|uniref:tRNA (adenine(22)-N(1))-methyltransferase n=1 Tax=uncultured Thomasclavelia sp. TaxID=3025759 RepID=UPI0025E4BD07|nr:class I SAM-dependent methyltransferase [uncultured Thomasclavelia sp.]
MKLSKRLQLIADVISKYKQGCILADIGSDHGYLPCYLVSNKVISCAYACDVAKGPLESAKETIKQEGLEEQVFPLLGDGLDPILDRKVDMISISGMGAYLISEILDKHRDYLRKVDVLFLQANSNTDHLRKYLFSNDWIIIDEKMVKDANHIYEVMVVTWRKNKAITYTSKDAEFGPILINNQGSLFKEKWQKQYDVYQKIQNTLPHDHPRYHEISDKLKMIEEVLHERN